MAKIGFNNLFFCRAIGTLQPTSLLPKEENLEMCLHTAISMAVFASWVKVLQCFMDWSSSAAYSAHLTQQCLSFFRGFRTVLERLMAELLVAVIDISVILVLSSLNQEVLLWLGSRSAGKPRAT